MAKNDKEIAMDNTTPSLPILKCFTSRNAIGICSIAAAIEENICTLILLIPFKKKEYMLFQIEMNVYIANIQIIMGEIVTCPAVHIEIIKCDPKAISIIISIVITNNLLSLAIVLLIHSISLSANACVNADQSGVITIPHTMVIILKYLKAML
jgi:hypothetical protein